MLHTNSQSTPYASGTAQAQCGSQQPALPQALRALPSDQLLRGQKIVGISHNGNLYKLRATNLGKLILTK